MIFHVNIMEYNQQSDVKWVTSKTPVPSRQSKTGANQPTHRSWGETLSAHPVDVINGNKEFTRNMVV